MLPCTLVRNRFHPKVIVRQGPETHQNKTGAMPIPYKTEPATTGTGCSHDTPFVACRLSYYEQSVVVHMLYCLKPWER